MRGRLLIGLIAATTLGGVAWWNFGPKESRVQVASVEVPELSGPAEEGAALFEANCASCHGANGAGSDTGPPLIHQLYQPGHHSDVAFQLAVRNGARAHHWPFGSMPPVEVSPTQTSH